MTIFTLGDRNFLISNLFLTIVNVLNAPKGAIQVLFGHQEQQSPPLSFNLLNAFRPTLPCVTTPILSRIFQSSSLIKCFLCCMSYSKHLSSTEPKTLKLYILDNDLTPIWKFNPLGAYQAVQSSTQKHGWHETTFHLSPHLTF